MLRRKQRQKQRKRKKLRSMTMLQRKKRLRESRKQQKRKRGRRKRKRTRKRRRNTLLGIFRIWTEALFSAIIIRFMVKLTPENASDFEAQDPRIAEHVARASERANQKIGRVSGEARDAFRHTFLRRLFAPHFLTTLPTREAATLHREVQAQYRDKPRSERKDSERTEGRQRAAAMAMREEVLAGAPAKFIRAPFEYTATGKDSAGAAMDVKVCFVVNQKILSSELPEGEITSAIESAMGGGWPWGTVFLNPRPHNVEHDEAEKVVKAFLQSVESFKALRKQFSSDGVSELNVQTALQFAYERPMETIDVVSKSTEHAEKELRKLKAKLQLIDAVEALGNISKETFEVDFDNIHLSESAIDADIASIGTTIPCTHSELGRTLKRRYQRMSTNTYQEEKVTESLSEGLEKLHKAKH